MLSILIPTYNYDCFELVNELHLQAKDLKIHYEILVADDASNEEMKINNRKINLLDNCSYIELKENIGRARIRNFLGESAKYEYLLFLDSDVRTCHNDFIEKYLRSINHNTVICGSTKFKRRIPQPNKTLRYIYGITGEEKSAKLCNQNPYAQFTSINFLIKKEIFMQTQFNKDFTQYGHEDTLFGKELEKKQIPVFHIDNPIFHNVPDTNEEFLNKTHKSIENALRYQHLLESHVRLLQLYNKINKAKLSPILFATYKLTHKILLHNLLSKNPNMKVFALYKLGYLCNLDKNTK